MNLLLVEDNGAVGRAIAKSLRAQGHTVTLVNNYADARAASGYFDVGVLDITLPDGDGIELCELLLKERRIGGALFCSGSIDDLTTEEIRLIAGLNVKAARLTARDYASQLEAMPESMSGARPFYAIPGLEQWTTEPQAAPSAAPTRRRFNPATGRLE